MSQFRPELLKDPLFQLNTVLWLTQSMPQRGFITPLLHQKGFSVYAIAPALGVPPGVALNVQNASLPLQKRVSPDVVLANKAERKFAFVECKASSFGVTTEQAIQARTLVLLAGEPAAEVLGMPPEQVGAAIIAYVLPEGERANLNLTLNALSDEMRKHHLPAGDSTVIGLGIDAQDLLLVLDESGGRFFGLVPGNHTVIQVQPDTDPRPLYFIPYDPDVAQSREEHLFCRRILFERIHSAVLVAVGRAGPPMELILNIRTLLNDATFGMYDLWENKNSAAHIRGLCRQLITALAKAVDREVKGSLRYESPENLKVSLSDAEQHHRVIAAVERFSCETMDLSAQPTPGLFDE